MAISSADIAALPSLSDADLLTLYRWALSNGAAGQKRRVGDSDVMFPPLDDLKTTIEWLEQRISAASNPGGYHALTEFGDAASGTPL